jgi:hypothetical protein
MASMKGIDQVYCGMLLAARVYHPSTGLNARNIRCNSNILKKKTKTLLSSHPKTHEENSPTTSQKYIEKILTATTAVGKLNKTQLRGLIREIRALGRR